MSANATSIEWTDRSANPIRARRPGTGGKTGHFCQKISEGCANCYASRYQPRVHLPTFPGTNKTPRQMGVDVFLDDRVLKAVLKIRKPCRIFWCDMSDMFGDWVPFEWIDQCFAVMALTPHITHQVLTKRPERMAEYSRNPGRLTVVAQAGALMGYGAATMSFRWPIPNVWLGTSVENQAAADERIPHLLKCPASVRFLSCEPLLGPIDIGFFGRLGPAKSMTAGGHPSSLDLHWVIVGGESGHA